MMKSADEIKKGLECCVNVPVGAPCPGECPLLDLCESCDGTVQRQILALIRELEERCKHMNDLRDAAAGRVLRLDAENIELLGEIDKLETKCHQLEAERDALMEEIRGRCNVCKHYEKDCEEEPCNSCKTLDGDEDNWQWRGVQKEE